MEVEARTIGPVPFPVDWSPAFRGLVRSAGRSIPGGWPPEGEWGASGYGRFKKPDLRNLVTETRGKSECLI